MCYSIYRYAKSNNTYMKDYDQRKKPSNFQYWEVNIAGQFNEDIKKKTIMKKVTKNIFSMFMFNILKNNMAFTMTYNFDLKE